MTSAPFRDRSGDPSAHHAVADLIARRDELHALARAAARDARAAHLAALAHPETRSGPKDEATPVSACGLSASAMYLLNDLGIEALGELARIDPRRDSGWVDRVSDEPWREVVELASSIGVRVPQKLGGSVPRVRSGRSCLYAGDPVFGLSFLYDLPELSFLYDLPELPQGVYRVMCEAGVESVGDLVTGAEDEARRFMGWMDEYARNTLRAWLERRNLRLGMRVVELPLDTFEGDSDASA